MVIAVLSLTGFWFWLGVSNQGPRLAILTYHDIGIPELEFRISLDRFVSHLDILQAQGYRFVTLEQVAGVCDGTVALQPKTVALTFDDAYSSFYEQVYPLLRQRGIPAAVFVITNDVGRGRRLSWEQMRQMEQDPAVHIRFYAHAYQGHELIDTDGDGRGESRFYTGYKWLPAQGRKENQSEYLVRIERDLTIAREGIRKHLGHESPFFATPGSGWSPTLAAVAKEAGYRYIFAPTWGKFLTPGWSTSRLPRLDAGSVGPGGGSLDAVSLASLLSDQDFIGVLNRRLFQGLFP